MINQMDQPSTRAEFERRFYLLDEMQHNGRVQFLPGTEGALGSVSAVRSLPNGRLDFLSVDESARLTANMMLNFGLHSLRIADDSPSDQSNEGP